MNPASWKTKNRGNLSKGKRESTFDPIKIGDWLVTKAYKTMAEVNKILAKNLPDRSAHKKDYYLQ